jgi:hypothetical protein
LSGGFSNLKATELEAIVVKKDQLVKVVGGSAVGFGLLGILVPRSLAKVFGVSFAKGEFVYVMRLAGAGNLGLGINMVLAREEDRQRLLTVSAAVDGLSAIFAAVAGVSWSLSKRSSILLTLTTSGVAALSLLAIREHETANDEQITSV